MNTSRKTRGARGAAGVAAGLVVFVGWLVMGPAQLGGSSSYVTTHGVSMEPRFHAGDLAVIRSADRYAVGDVAAYRSHVLNTDVMHRIVAIDDGRYTFKGDHNSWLDPEQPTRSQLIGRLAVRVPQGGVWFKRLTSPAALAGFALLVLGVGGTAAVQTRRQRKRRGTVPRHAARTRSTPTLTGLPEPLRIAATTSAAVGVLALGIGALAWTGPLTSIATVKQASTRSVTFSYTAAVPRSPAYAGTTATSPDPIFRKLANAVDVHVTYQGGPGTITINGELSAPSGWHATLPLAPATTFTGGRYDGTVHLDLAALAAQATAAATATGIPATQISLHIVPVIRTGTAAPFSPALALDLSPLQLKLAADKTTLVARDPNHSSAQTSVPRRMGLLGHDVSVATVRPLSLLGLFLSLLAGGFVVILGRRLAPGSEAAGIRQRYSQLLVPIQPMPTAAGRPVIDVTDFGTLAKLAERYGLLVLHWARSGVETFLVQDEGTTFRYRTANGAHQIPDDAEGVPATMDLRPSALG
jgi:signal peptidase I